jgi:hypothetical protein
MLEALQKTTKSIIEKAFREVLPKDRRSYGQDIRIWNDRDPRVDQSFFHGAVPGFVIGNDQSIVDWNVGFELVFGESEGVKRGMKLASWFELIENFKRLPNREENLGGEAVLPITDRNRVVFISPAYGRMVFTKIMSPVLDRISGRVIGWNVALNINSVHERVKFFTDLNEKIQRASRHARFILGFDQVASRSKVIHEAVHKAVLDVGPVQNILVLGAVGAAQFITEIMHESPHAQVSVMDDDVEALRHLKSQMSRFGKRVKIVRRKILDLSIVPEDRFDAALLLWPRVDQANLELILVQLRKKLVTSTRISIISWVDETSSEKFWRSVRRDLEQRHEIDLVRWHINLIQEESAAAGAVPLYAGSLLAAGLAQALG